MIRRLAVFVLLVFVVIALYGQSEGIRTVNIDGRYWLLCSQTERESFIIGAIISRSITDPVYVNLVLNMRNMSDFIDFVSVMYQSPGNRSMSLYVVLDLLFTVFEATDEYKKCLTVK